MLLSLDMSTNLYWNFSNALEWIYGLNGLKRVSRTVAQANNHIPKIWHPYFYWYFYENTSVCMHYTEVGEF